MSKMIPMKGGDDGWTRGGYLTDECSPPIDIYTDGGTQSAYSLSVNIKMDHMVKIGRG